MKRKRALVTLTLVDESMTEADAKIAQELLEWFKEPHASVPWVRGVEGVRVRDC